MKFYVLCFLVTLTLFATDSLGAPHKKRVGLLTDSYGIVTDADLDEEEKKATPRPFPPDLPSFQYWQCFKHEGYFLGCENEGEAIGEKWDIGSATFWIRANGKKTEFSTRRNWDISFCRDMISEILKIMEGQPIVCVSASYGKYENTEVWTIDRVKTKKGEWSWFARPEKHSRQKPSKKARNKSRPT